MILRIPLSIVRVWLAIGLGLSALGASAPSLAADDAKPAFFTDTKIIEASVVIDPALKAHPSLYEKLLASGKRQFDNAKSDAARKFKASPEIFEDGRKFYFKRGYVLRSTIGPYVSILRADDTYEGGAHPNHVVDTLLWDTQAAKFINIKPFFKEMADNGPTLTLLASRLRVAIAAEKKARGAEVGDPDKDQWFSSVTPKITDIGGIALAPSTEAGKSAGLIAYFSPYAVGSYAEGEYIVFVPWTAFKDHLSDEGVALFRGERPAEDAEKD